MRQKDWWVEWYKGGKQDSQQFTEAEKGMRKLAMRLGSLSRWSSESISSHNDDRMEEAKLFFIMGS